MIHIEVLGRRIEYAGRPAVMGNLIDITEQTRTAEERERLLVQLKESAEQIHQIMNTVPEGVLLLDTDLRILLHNSIADTYLAALMNGDELDHQHPLTHLGGRPINELLTAPPHGLWHEVSIKRRRFQIIARPVETSPTIERYCRRPCPWATEKRSWWCMSGHPLGPETEIRITNSVCDWIQKPPNLERLAETLARVLHE